MTKVKNKESLNIEDLRKAGVNITKGSEYGLGKLITTKPLSLEKIRAISKKAKISLSEELLKMREQG